MKENNFIKKKKGFTLIELLAVLVLLAILALIVIPIVLRLINKAREDSAKRSAESYLDGVRKTIMSDDTLSQMKILSCDVINEGAAIGCCEEYDCNGMYAGSANVDVDGRRPTDGKIYFNDDGSVSGIEGMKFSGKYYVSGSKGAFSVATQKSSGGKTINTKSLTYKGEDYYIIDSTDEYYVAAKKWPLSVEEVNANGAGRVNVYSYSNQGSAGNIDGYGMVAWHSNSNCYKGDKCDVREVCDEWNNCSEEESCSYVDKHGSCPSSYKDSDIKVIVDTWANNNLNMDDLVTDGYGYKVRLLSDKDIINKLGGTNSSNSVGGTTAVAFTNRTPRWMKASTVKTWMMDVDEDYRNSAHMLTTYGVNVTNFWNSETWSAGAVRPVINVKKSAVD
jgi:type IV pilus assembly protein PilA